MASTGFTIGVNGLRVAQQALELIGTNIANAGTEGYHRQELSISPVMSNRVAANVIMVGPRVDSIRRMSNMLLEQELLRQKPLMGQYEQELLSLETIENAFGEIASEGLSSALSKFFGSLSELAGNPESDPLLREVVGMADELSGRFRSLSNFLQESKRSVELEANTLIDKVNDLTHEIALLNAEIYNLAVQGADANLLRDQRDQSITELAELVDVRVDVVDPSKGIVNVVTWGIPLVSTSIVHKLEIGKLAGGDLAIAVEGTNSYQTDLEGGKIGGLLSVHNKILTNLQDNLDTLAVEIMDQINAIHVQGIGADGSYSMLSGITVSSETLDQWDANIEAGQFTIRLTDPTGATTYHTVDLDPAVDTVDTIRDKINAIDPAHLSASSASSMLRIEGLAGWKFDFTPAVDLDIAGLTGPPAMSVSGIYTGESKETYTCTVVEAGGGTGTVGETAGLSIEVRNSAGELMKTVNVGLGEPPYAPGDRIDIGGGIKLAIDRGDLNDGETFTIEVWDNSDQTDFLAAAGMNTFFRGNSAGTMHVRTALKEKPSLLAFARGMDGKDNTNVLKMSKVGQKDSKTLGNINIHEFYRRIAIGIGQDVEVRQARHKSLEQMMLQLSNQRDEISGVDMNEEAAKLMVFQQMFQAIAKFIQMHQQALKSLLDMV